MLILFNKAISVACFAMKCWQFFLLPHFSQSIDADTNVSAAHSFKLQRKIGWDWLWGGNPQCSLGGRTLCPLFCSLLPMSPRSAAAEGHLTSCVGGRCPLGTSSPALDSLPAAALGAGSTAGILPCRTLCCSCKASLQSSHAPVGTANSILPEGFGIHAPNLGPSLESPGFLIIYHHFMVV